MSNILSVDNLHVAFHTPEGRLPAVRGIGFDLERGKALGLVGESGCGKTVTALSLMRLVPPPGRIESGTITLFGRDLIGLEDRRMRKIRGKEMAMIFQEPMSSLNPVFTIADQIMEAIRVHERVGTGEARERTIRLLRDVEIPDPARRREDYPHQLSGGQRQRVMIAMAIACNPAVLLADEPTTALDVTVQARILALLTRLREKRKMAPLLVTHDLGVVAQETDRVAVMYLGRIVESALTGELFNNPLHPYTRALLRSIPRPGEGKERLETIPGVVPDLNRIPRGCSFHPRCPLAEEVCRREVPINREIRPGHRVECHLAGR